MKKIFYLLAVSILVASFAACKNDSKAEEEWRNANASKYDEITKDMSYRELQTSTGPRGVYYKVLNSGTGTEHPLQTSTVKVLYKATYYDSTVLDNGSSLNNIPVEFSSVASTVRGFSFALQNMVVGDNWKICIPYYLGYGAAGQYDSYSGQLLVRGYSTLFFDVELVSITKYP